MASAVMVNCGVKAASDPQSEALAIWTGEEYQLMRKQILGSELTEEQKRLIPRAARDVSEQIGTLEYRAEWVRSWGNPAAYRSENRDASKLQKRTLEWNRYPLPNNAEGLYSGRSMDGGRR
ncbi:MAG: hypothetical protein LBR78_00870 [Holosporales bacterium]|nr:hypothetical protein [Holosporales bacterium]